MIPLLLLLLLPLSGAALLAFRGERPEAATVNASFAGAGLLCAAVLALKVVSGGPIVLFGEQFHLDAFSVFLVVLTAFVGFTTALFSRPYMRTEADRGRIGPGGMRMYHAMYQLFLFIYLAYSTAGQNQTTTCFKVSGQCMNIW